MPRATAIVVASIFYPRSLEIVHIGNEMTQHTHTRLPRTIVGERIILRSNIVIYERVKETPRSHKEEEEVSLQPVPVNEAFIYESHFLASKYPSGYSLP